MARVRFRAHPNQLQPNLRGMSAIAETEEGKKFNRVLVLGHGGSRAQSRKYGSSTDKKSVLPFGCHRSF